MDMGTLVVFFSFHICVIYASAFQQAENGLTPRPITTAPQKLDDRDAYRDAYQDAYVSIICGFYSDSAMNTISAWECTDDLPCGIDRYVTPNIIFCSSDPLTLYTKYYRYGVWPQGGCGIRESCCPSDYPYVLTAIYDKGATYMYECTQDTYSFSVYTQLQDSSVYLTPYMTIDVATSTPIMAATPRATLKLSSTTASPQSITSATSSTTASSALISSTSSMTVTSAASSTTASSGGTTVPQASCSKTSSPDNTKLKIELAAGLGAGILIITILAASISIVIFLMRRSNQARTHPDTQEHAESRWTESVTMISAEPDGAGDRRGGPT
ncbi:hypothetical protein V8E54_001994 [Elaphomyces granulatus]